MVVGLVVVVLAVLTASSSEAVRLNKLQRVAAGDGTVNPESLAVEFAALLEKGDSSAEQVVYSDQEPKEREETKKVEAGLQDTALRAAPVSTHGLGRLTGVGMVNSGDHGNTALSTVDHYYVPATSLTMLETAAEVHNGFTAAQQAYEKQFSKEFGGVGPVVPLDKDKFTALETSTQPTALFPAFTHDDAANQETVMVPVPVRFVQLLNRESQEPVEDVSPYLTQFAAPPWTPPSTSSDEVGGPVPAASSGAYTINSGLYAGGLQAPPPPPRPDNLPPPPYIRPVPQPKGGADAAAPPARRR